MFYRVQQFIKAITASISAEEHRWVEYYLSEKECELFFKLKVHEQRHCIDVAKILAKQSNEDEGLIRLGLLHDIGKIKYPLNPIEKSMIVLLDRLTKGKIKQWTSLKMVKCYYHHAELGYNLLRNLDDYNIDFLECIKNHHRSEKVNQTLKWLQDADNLC